jgi:aspartyl-tRNA(Asn)/glutamyl-tRNA(Gln) amidotransferase subunit B
MTIMRSKEEADDYRYFPEPDLVPVAPDAAWVERLRGSLPELPGARIRRFEAAHGLPFSDAAALNRTPELADFFERTAAAAGDAKGAANWTLNEFSAHLNESGLEPGASRVTPEALAELVGLVRDGVVGSAGAKQVFAALVEGEGPPRAIVEQRGLGQIADESQLRAVVDEVVAANPQQAEQFRAGKQALIGYFVGQVMKATGGRAEPRRVQELLREVLG